MKRVSLRRQSKYMLGGVNYLRSRVASMQRVSPSASSQLERGLVPGCGGSMVRWMVSIMLTTATLAGRASQPKPAPNSRARVTFNTLAPSRGAIVAFSDVITADLSYEIFDFSAGAKYLLMPLLTRSTGTTAPIRIGRTASRL